MRKAFAVLAVLAVLFAFSGVQAADKDMTLRGSVTCAKCALKEADKCTTVIVVKEGDKKVVYTFDAVSDKKFHKEICKAGKDATVVGTVSEKDGKKTLTVTKLDFK